VSFVRLALMLTLFTAATVLGRSEGFRITSPTDGSDVPERPDVVGTGATGEVWVVVHPTDVSEFWAQPPVTVKEDGSWKVKIYIGRPGTVDVGKTFEVRAFMGVAGRVADGLLLGWPDAASKSQVVEVKRK
jgi:hypothetical protein